MLAVDSGLYEAEKASAEERRKAGVKPSGTNHGRSGEARDRAGKAVGVSGSYVQKVDRVRREAALGGSS